MRSPLQDSAVNPSRHRRGLGEVVGAFTRRFGKEGLFALLMENRVPAAPVRDLQEVVNAPHMLARRAQRA